VAAAAGKSTGAEHSGPSLATEFTRVLTGYRFMELESNGLGGWPTSRGFRDVGPFVSTTRDARFHHEPTVSTIESVCTQGFTSTFDDHRSIGIIAETACSRSAGL
jgi:hypothetical protein